MQKHYNASLQTLLAEELKTHLSQHFKDSIVPSTLQSQLLSKVLTALGSTSTADAGCQLEIVATGMTSPIMDFFTSSNSAVREHRILHSVSALQSSFAKQGVESLQALRHVFVTRKPPCKELGPYSSCQPEQDPFLLLNSRIHSIC